MESVYLSSLSVPSWLFIRFGLNTQKVYEGIYKISLLMHFMSIFKNIGYSDWGYVKIYIRTSGFLLLFFSSDLSASVSHLHSDLLGSFDDLSSFLNRFACTLELTLWAISAQKVRLFIKRTSRSLTLWTKNFLRPLGRKYLVVLSDP